MKKNRITEKMIRILGVMSCLLLIGCGKTIEEGVNSDRVAAETSLSSDLKSETVSESSEVSGCDGILDVWDPDVIHRQILVDEGAMCGVLFLGYTEGYADDLKEDPAWYHALLEDTGYLESFPFLTDIPDSAIVQTTYGQELYCIIPKDIHASVSVNQWITDPNEGFKGETGEVLYRSEKGTPILLRCNVSELVSDVEIVIVDSEGDQMRWLPSLSSMDGHVFVENADGAVFDFSVYDKDGPVNLLSAMTGEDLEYYWEEEYQEVLAYVSAPNVKLKAEDAGVYRELAKTLASNMAQRREKLYSSFKENIEAARSDYPDTKEFFHQYESTEHAMVRRSDSRVLSILYNGNLYSGGMHGYRYYWGENYDTETGKVLNLTDVVDDINAFAAAVKDQLYFHWGKDGYYEDLDPELYIKDNLEQLPWTLDYHGITVYFNPFDIAPYANGIQIVTVAFDAEPELFNRTYTETPECYGMQLDMEIPFYYDVDSDGEPDEILVYGIPNDNGYVVHNVHVDRECYVEFDENEIYAYAIYSPHLIHMEDGRNYLMIENRTDNDYRTNTIYELTSGTPVKVGHILSGMHCYMEEEGVFFKEVLTDPHSFRMDSRTWCVGTYDGYMTYYFDESGFPLSSDDYYTFAYMPEFEVKKDFRLHIVDEYGEVGEEITVRAGEMVRYYHTDSSLFADFILSDGQMGRADLEWFEGYCLIDGIMIEDLFSGVVFAG